MKYEIMPEALAQLVSLSKKLVTFKSCGLLRVDDLAKSRKVRHCERSEAISWIITICNYWIPAPRPARSCPCPPRFAYPLGLAMT
jgi:hypothetical protein